VNAFRNRCKRGGDLTGRIVGPYCAVRPVGDDAASSVYYVLQCPLCQSPELWWQTLNDVLCCLGCGAIFDGCINTPEPQNEKDPEP